MARRLEAGVRRAQDRARRWRGSVSFGLGIAREWVGSSGEIDTDSFNFVVGEVGL